MTDGVFESVRCSIPPLEIKMGLSMEFSKMCSQFEITNSLWIHVNLILFQTVRKKITVWNVNIDLLDSTVQYLDFCGSTTLLLTLFRAKKIWQTSRNNKFSIHTGDERFAIVRTRQMIYKMLCKQRSRLFRTSKTWTLVGFGTNIKNRSKMTIYCPR